jgi:hypothetical protein
MNFFNCKIIHLPTWIQKHYNLVEMPINYPPRDKCLLSASNRLHEMKNGYYSLILPGWKGLHQRSPVVASVFRRVSFCCDLPYNMHASQFSTSCLMFAATFGGHRYSRVLLITLSTPQCDLWRHSFREVPHFLVNNNSFFSEFQSIANCEFVCHDDVCLDFG